MATGKLDSCGCVVLSGHKLTNKDCKKCTSPKSLFSLCTKKIRQVPELERELFRANLLLDFTFTYEFFVQNILDLIRRPYFNNNKQFERYFRNLVTTHLFHKKNPRKLFDDVQTLLKKIKSYKKIYGMVSDVLIELRYLSEELIFLLNLQ